MRFCTHPDGCTTDDGQPGKHRRNGLCDIHDQRLRKSGSVGARGMRWGARKRKDGQTLERTAESFLARSQPRTSRGVIVRRKPQRNWVVWRDGSRSIIPQKSLDAWCARGWLAMSDPHPDTGHIEIVIVEGARASARATLAKRAENVVRWRARQGSHSE